MTYEHAAPPSVYFGVCLLALQRRMLFLQECVVEKNMVF